MAMAMDGRDEKIQFRRLPGKMPPVLPEEHPGRYNKIQSRIRANLNRRARHVFDRACARIGGRGVHYRMKKLFFLLCLLPMLATVGRAQESRQDVNVSFIGTYQPIVTGNAITQTATTGKGILLGYRFMLTPSSALEANYQYSRFNMKYVAPFSAANFYTAMEEGSIAYVRSFVYKKFNPFGEGGGGLLLFRPIDNSHTTTNAGLPSKAIAGIFGGGIAYELSPSWDLRAEYRAAVFGSVDFGLKQYQTNRYYLISQPTVGLAYHF